MGPDFQTSQLRYKATSSDNQRGGCWHEQGLVQTSDWVQAHWPWNKAVTVKSQVGRQNVRLWDTQNLSRFGIVWPTHFRKLVLSCPSTSIPNRCSVSGLLNISRNGDFGVGQIPPPESQKPAVGMLEEYPHAAFIQTSNVKCWESRTSHASVHIYIYIGLWGYWSQAIFPKISKSVSSWCVPIFPQTNCIGRLPRYDKAHPHGGWENTSSHWGEPGFKAADLVMKT